MGEKLLDQSGLVVLRNWVRAQIQAASLGNSGTTMDATRVWYNETPTTITASSTTALTVINVDLSGFDGAIIEYAYCTSSYVDPVHTTRVIPIGEGDVLEDVSPRSAIYGGRCCTVHEDKVIFGYGYNHSTTKNDSVAVPIAIYGVHGAYKKTVPTTSGRTYLITPHNMDGGIIKAFTPVTPSGGKAPLAANWLYSWCGTGFTLVSQMAGTSYCVMHSTQYFDLTNYSTLHISGAGMCYSTYDYIGLYAGTGVAVQSYQNMGSNMISSCKIDLVSGSTNNVWKKFSTDFNVSSLTGNHVLGAMCAGSGDNNYCGVICIEEAYLT